MNLDKKFLDRCEGLAVDWRYRLQLRPFDRLPAEQLLNELGGEAVTPNQIPYASPDAIAHLMTCGNWSAGIVRRKPLLIVYHPAASPARHQSNLMHELAHVLLDHPMVGFSQETGLPLRDKRHEEEATHLGGCLQIPSSGLEWAVNQGFTCGQIANHFQASRAMVRFRSNMTRILVPS